MSKETNKKEVKKLEKKCKKLKLENEELKQEVKNLDKWIDDHANPRVKDIIAACEYTRYVVVDQLLNEIVITKDNMVDVYMKNVEHVDACNDTVRIWTFDRMDEVQGIPEADLNKYVPSSGEYDMLVLAILRTIEANMVQLYEEKHGTPMVYSPFYNPNVTYKNNMFSVSARNSKTQGDEDDLDHPRFSWGPVKIFWDKHAQDGIRVYTRMGFDAAETYAIMLSKCVKSLKDDPIIALSTTGASEEVSEPDPTEDFINPAEIAEFSDDEAKDETGPEVGPATEVEEVEKAADELDTTEVE